MKSEFPICVPSVTRTSALGVLENVYAPTVIDIPLPAPEKEYAPEKGSGTVSGGLSAKLYENMPLSVLPTAISGGRYGVADEFRTKSPTLKTTAKKTTA
jgi:hypothetical protein